MASWCNIHIYIYMYYIVMASWCNKLLVGLLIPAFFTRCFPGRGNSFWERVSRMFPLPCTSSSRNACCTKRTCYLRSPKAQTSPRLGHKSDIVKCSNPKRPVKITWGFTSGFWNSSEGLVQFLCHFVHPANGMRFCDPHISERCSQQGGTTCHPQVYSATSLKHQILPPKR